jgi:hypothetical protein
MRVLFRRLDGSFVIERDGLPYHVTRDSPEFVETQRAEASSPAPLEPGPEIPEWANALPPDRRVVPALAFLESLTPDERIAIRAAARENAGLEDWLDMLRAAQEVDLDDTRTISGLNAMVNAGLLTRRRADTILGTEDPEDVLAAQGARRRS